jgi:hypothetical protein
VVGVAKDVVADFEHLKVPVEGVGVDPHFVILSPDVVAVLVEVSLASGLGEAGLDGEPFLGEREGFDVIGEVEVIIQTFQLFPSIDVWPVVVVGLGIIAIEEGNLSGSVSDDEGADAFEALHTKDGVVGPAIILSADVFRDGFEFVHFWWLFYLRGN